VPECLPLDEVMSLFILSSSRPRRIFATWVAGLAMLLLRLLGLLEKPEQREAVVSHPEIYPEVPVVGRPGVRLPYVKHFALHYQMFRNNTVVTLMPSVAWTVPNAELMAELRASLERIQSIICGE
jgi:hypothetical protein